LRTEVGKGSATTENGRWVVDPNGKCGSVEAALEGDPERETG